MCADWPAGVEGAERRGDHTRRRILDAAMELFGRDGFDRTTVRSIARACGLTDAALYYYFSSKRAILDALWEAPQARDLRLVPVAPRLTQERLMALVDALEDVIDREDRVLRLLVQQALAGDATALAMRNEAIASWRQHLLPHFEVAFEPEEAARRVELLLMVVAGTTLTRQMHGAPAPGAGGADGQREHVRALIAAVLPITPAAVSRACGPSCNG